MNLQQFRVLIAVRDTGSLTRAAEALNYGVPTVAHHLRALEAHLQAPLVERGRAGTALTPLGEFFAAEIASVLARLDAAERAVADRRDAGVVTLRVGTFASIGSRLLPPAMAELQQRTSVRIEITEGEPTEIVRLLRAGDLHAGIIYDTSDEPAFESPDLSSLPLLSEPYRVLVGEGSEWAKRGMLDLTELTDVGWMLSRASDEASDRVLKRVFGGIGSEVRALVRTDDAYMIHGLVESGLGLALTTRAAVDLDFDVDLRATVQPLGDRRVSFVTRSDGAPPATAWLGKIMQRIAAARSAPPAMHPSRGGELPGNLEHANL